MLTDSPFVFHNPQFRLTVVAKPNVDLRMGILRTNELNGILITKDMISFVDMASNHVFMMEDVEQVIFVNNIDSPESPEGTLVPTRTYPQWNRNLRLEDDPAHDYRQLSATLAKNTTLTKL